MNVIIFIIHGIIGALMHVLVHAEKPDDIKNFVSIKNLVIGALAGYIYYILYSEYSFPNSLASIIFGYFAKDIIYMLFEKKFKRIIEESIW